MFYYSQQLIQMVSVLLFLEFLAIDKKIITVGARSLNEFTEIRLLLYPDLSAKVFGKIVKK